MTNVLIIGGGLTGLATALFLARRGHTATILERDADEPPVDPLGAFDGWRRSGVAQRRQSHNFLARASKVLSAEAPDVVDALIAGEPISENQKPSIGCNIKWK